MPLPVGLGHSTHCHLVSRPLGLGPSGIQAALPACPSPCLPRGPDSSEPPSWREGLALWTPVPPGSASWWGGRSKDSDPWGQEGGLFFPTSGDWLLVGCPRKLARGAAEGCQACGSQGNRMELFQL